MRVPSTQAALLVAVALAALACGGGADEADPGAPDTVVRTPGPSPLPDDAPDPAGATLLDATIPNGSPMPEADRAGGVPAYPGAIVHTLRPRDLEGLLAFEAFTPDSWRMVEAFYDTTLRGPWRKTEARDMTIYERGEDEAAITLSPWNPEELPPGDHPEAVTRARTAIGVAWRTDR